MWMAAVAGALVLIVGLFAYHRYSLQQTEKNYPPDGEFVTVEGVKLHYISKGEGKTVVFLHGGILTGNDFRDAIDLAAEQGYRAIAFDRPGYGYSERPKNKRVTPRDQVRLIHGALRQLGVQKPVLVGHSWSGTMTLAYALDYPDEVSGVVLLAGAMYKEGYPAERGDLISQLVTTPVIGDLFLHTVIRSPLGAALTKLTLTHTFAPEPIPEGYREATLAFWLRPGQFKANREDVLAFVPAAKEASKRYREIRIPLIIMVGENDPFGTKEQAHRLKREVPHAKLKVIPGVGHMIPQNHPELVMRALGALSE